MVMSWPLRIATLSKGGVVGPYPAPAGYRWSFVVENGQAVTDAGQRVVELQQVN